MPRPKRREPTEEIFISNVPLDKYNRCVDLVNNAGYPSLAAFAREGLDRQIAHVEKQLKARRQRADRRRPAARRSARRAASRRAAPIQTPTS